MGQFGYAPFDPIIESSVNDTEEVVSTVGGPKNSSDDPSQPIKYEDIDVDNVNSGV